MASAAENNLAQHKCCPGDLGSDPEVGAWTDGIAASVEMLKFTDEIGQKILHTYQSTSQTEFEQQKDPL